jgi:serine/threonine protein kinase
MSEFKLVHLNKTDLSLTRNPDKHKFFLSSCQTRITNRTSTTEGWLTILKLLKIDSSEYDKSRVLLGALQDYGEIVVKIGDSDDIRREYEMSTQLQSIKGFVKYICFFQCNDNFRNIPSADRTTLCKGEGRQMKVILMPYFPLGSIASFHWQNYTIEHFHTCLKHAILSMITAFFKLNILHGDFHIGNVLLKKTKQKTISYSIPNLGFQTEIETHGLRTWIMDFENSKVANMSDSYNSMMSINYFYGDLSKFFTMMQYIIKMIDPRTIAPITVYIGKLTIRGNMIKHDELQHILILIDGIQFLPTQNVE